MRYDSYDYQLLAQAEGEGMVYRGELELVGFDYALAECVKAERPWSPLPRIDDIGG